MRARRLLRAPEHADHAPHLGQRLAAGLLDDEQGLALLLLVGLEEPARRRRLDGHHADAVADDVVELARDPAALVGDGELCPLGALSLGPLEAFLRLSASWRLRPRPNPIDQAIVKKMVLKTKLPTPPLGSL